MKTALVYDWFAEEAGGGEKAFEAIYKLYPSPIYTLFQSAQNVQTMAYAQAEIHSSFVQKMPRFLKKYRSYLPFFPLAIEQLDLSAYDLILSCSHCVAKGVLTHAEQIHLCYCYTPMRYAWDLYHQYLGEARLQRGWKGRLAQLLLHYLRIWDCQSSHRVDGFAAVSHHVARRIYKTYGKKATTIYPPVNTHFFDVGEKKEDFYVTASRFVPYKKIDLIVEAFSRMPDKKLVVIGEGPDFDKVRSKATKNIDLLGYQTNEALKSYLQKGRAFLFAALEDFGIVPVEAQACGTAVIGYGKGGLLETVHPESTGVFFDEQTPEAICKAVVLFEQKEDTFDPLTIRKWAQQFSEERFAQQFTNWVQQAVAAERTSAPCTKQLLTGEYSPS